MSFNTVTLYLYDLSNGMSKILSQQLVGKYIEGIWHTSVVVYGKEFYFQNGVQNDPPKTTMFGNPVKEMHIGETELSEQDFFELLETIKPDFAPEKYHVFQNNCNHFSNEVLQLLLDKTVPFEILNQSKEFENTPIGAFILQLQQQNTDKNLMTHIQELHQEVSAKKVKQIWNEEEYFMAITNPGKILIDFYADWCGPCQRIAPVLEQLAVQYKDIQFYKLDTQASDLQNLCITLGITSLPTFVLMQNEQIIQKIQGANQQALQQALELLNQKQ